MAAARIFAKYVFVESLIVPGLAVGAATGMWFAVTGFNDPTWGWANDSAPKAMTRGVVGAALGGMVGGALGPVTPLLATAAAVSGVVYAGNQAWTSRNKPEQPTAEHA